MNNYNNFYKKELNLTRTILSYMKKDSLTRVLRYNIIRGFFVNNKGSIHDLLEEINNNRQERKQEPIGVRALQKTLKELSEQGLLKYESKKPSQDELIVKYGKGFSKKTYMHLKKEADLQKVKFLKLKEGFKFSERIMLHEEQILKQTIAILEKNQGEGNPIYTDIIEALEDTIYHDLISSKKILGDENKSYKKGFDKIKEALVNNEVLEILITDLNKEEDQTIEFHPHFLKIWNNKWYALGHSPQKTFKPYVLPVDTRIKKIKTKRSEFIKSEINYLDDEGSSAFFDQIIGVTNLKEREVENITIKIHSRRRYNRLKLKRAHFSMEFFDDEMTIKFKVKRNPELTNFIMEHADEIEFLEPKSLKLDVQKKLKKANTIYNTKQ